MTIVIALVGLVIFALSLPLVWGRVPRNDFYGLRTPRTMSGSAAEWYAVNKKAGIIMCALGILLGAVSIGAYLFGEANHLAISCFSVVLLLICISGVMIRFWK